MGNKKILKLKKLKTRPIEKKTKKLHTHHNGIVVLLSLERTLEEEA